MTRPIAISLSMAQQASAIVTFRDARFTFHRVSEPVCVLPRYGVERYVRGRRWAL